jgi:uncharacterized protein YhaN
MKLLELEVQAFGRLRNRKFIFHPRLNVIVGRNEAGKSTLQQAVLALLYGFYDGGRALPREHEAHERFRPWLANDYAGRLKYRLDDGATLLVHRDFSKAEVNTQLLDGLTGEDLSTRYNRGRHGKIDFMEKQLGMSRAVFLASAFVQQGELRGYATREASLVTDAILSLLDSASPETSADRAVLRLEHTLRELASERSPHALLAQARARLDDLREKYAWCQASHRTIQAELAKAETLELEVEELAAQVEAYERQSAEAQLGILRGRVQRWRESEARREQLQAESSELQKLEAFPLNLKERFFQLRDEYLHLDRLQRMQAEERSSLELRLMGATQQGKNLQMLEPLWQTGTFEDFFAKRQRWQTAYEELLKIEEEAHDAGEEVKKIGMSDEERAALKRLDLAQFEKLNAVEAQFNDAEVKVNQLRADNKSNAKRNTERERVFNFSAGVAVIGLVYALAQFLSAETTASKVGDALLLGLSFGGLLLLLNLKNLWDNQDKELKQQLEEAETQLLEKKGDRREALNPYKVESVGELMQRHNVCLRVDAVLEKNQALKKEMSALEQDLLAWASPLGIPYIAPDTLPEAEKRLRESHQSHSATLSLRQQLGALETQEQATREKLKDYTQQLESLLAAAEIREPAGEKAFQAFITACQKREYLDSLRAQQQQAETLSAEILENEPYEDLTARVAQLEAQLAALPPVSSAYAAPLREFSEAALAALRAKRESVLQEVNQKQQTLSALKERVATRLQDLPSLAEVEEDMALETAQIERYERVREALEIAREGITQAAQRLHRDFVPKLNEFVGRHLQTLTAGRYTGTLIDPESFHVRVLGSEHAAPVELERLSFGTREQVYLLLRAAVVELFAQTGETIPLFCDDPFAHADAQRLAHGLEVFYLLSETQQIFYFTKDESVARFFSERIGAHCVLALT